jgi:DNA-binding transcriptional LysR family regulator
LSDRGQEVFESSKSLVSAVSNFESRLGELRHRIIGTLRVGFVDNTITNPDIPLDEIILVCLKAAPDAEFDLTISNPENLIAEIVNGGIDIAVMPQIDVAGGFRQSHFYDELHSLYCGDRHPLFGAEKPPKTAEIEACGFVVRPYANRRELHHFPKARVHAHASNMEAQAAFILSGAMIGYLPDHFAARWSKAGRMRALLPSARIKSPFVFMSSGDAAPPPLMRLFIREVTARATGTSSARRKIA